MKKRINRLCILLLSFSLAACVTIPHTGVESSIAIEDFDGALSMLESQKSSLYRDRDAVLYYLDKGVISHYAGQYDDSIQLLQSAELGIQAAFTKSVTMEITTYITNDTAQEYGGEDYEDIYVKAFNALNYYHKGNLEGALVEVRGMSQKLDQLAAKYAGLIQEMQQEAEVSGVSIEESATASAFSNSALACYLSMLFYRSIGDSNTEVDWRNLQKAFTDAPGLYNFPVPSSIADELTLSEGNARLNLISFSGFSPVKEEKTMRIPLGTGWIKVALPELVSRPSRVARVAAVFSDGRRVDLELLENIEAVAYETYKMRESVVYLKSILRATLKGGTAAALNATAASKTDTEPNTSLLMGLLGLGTQIFAEATERADLRISRYFPGKVHIAGIFLPPGVYSFAIEYYDARNNLLKSIPFDNVSIERNKLNLMEAVCIK